MIQQDFAPMKGRTVLVVGDLILDHYLWGNVERTTPEAPVPIVRHVRDSHIMGGAANVAHNIVALGGKAILIGAVGRDENARLMREMVKKAGIAGAGIATVSDRPTTVKTRVISMRQQLLRIDNEENSPIDAKDAETLLKAVGVAAEKADVMLLSDYAKGVLSPEVIAGCIAAARKASIPVLVDPKGRDFSKYKGVDYLTPNRRELAIGSGQPASDENEIGIAAAALIRKCGLKALVVTLSEEGIAIMRPRRKMVKIQARAREVSDVNGAGDSTIATLALGIAAGLPLDDAALLANYAGGVVCGKFGVATVSPAELKSAATDIGIATKLRSEQELSVLLPTLQGAGRKIVFTNGCFDLLHAGHIRFLHEAKKLGDLLVVGLNTDRSVRELKGAPRPILPQDERAAILSALEVVDYIVLYDELTPESLLRDLKPDVLVKGRNIAEDEVVGREIVLGYGGMVRQLPMLHRSTVEDVLHSIVGKVEKK